MTALGGLTYLKGGLIVERDSCRSILLAGQETFVKGKGDLPVGREKLTIGRGRVEDLRLDTVQTSEIPFAKL
jgi:hypothetical protein